MKALEISKHILSRVNLERFEEMNEGISNLKLQKLLFYIQKTSISVYDKKMFYEDIECWRYGPVVPEVYHRFKSYSKENIDIVKEKDFLQNKEQLSYQEIFILDFVLDEYNKYTPGTLVNMTHKDSSWINNYVEDSYFNNTIPLEDMKDKNLAEKFLQYSDDIENLLKVI